MIKNIKEAAVMRKFVVKVFRDNKIISRLAPARNEYEARAYSSDDVISIEPYIGQRIEEDIQVVVTLKKGSFSNIY